MKPNETIFDMYTRFTQIVTSLHTLGRELSNYEKVKKILRCLPSSFDAKITAISESKDLNTYSIDNLLGSLIAYEQGVNQRNHNVGERKKEKTVALKANNSDTGSSGSKNDDIALITRQFKSFLRKSHKHHQNGRKGKDNKNFKGSNVVCFECRKPGHVRADCQFLLGRTCVHLDENFPESISSWHEYEFRMNENFLKDISSWDEFEFVWTKIF
ncbi:Retrovirus-related Pol polyprotein from transposon TNT 1-94 [Dendrobium catenatum]|uniref:Retrovirus-related Pol polyprotein from transposon TNT 1-94 n=1 Tax=Dendrobium catenatum TaxID=906689 RepID=A0A2I0WMC2_9ASPA|nr:Retrovirus-related Pol polyprotein from transposon TNT 1-94 [Dendrobium catenatum]